MNCKDSRFLFVLFFFILTIVESTGIQVYSNDPGSPRNTSSFGSLKHENQLLKHTVQKIQRGLIHLHTHTYIYIYWIISFQSTEEENQEKSNLTARPTAPNPKTATVDPFVGLATFIVAPRPFFFRHKNKIKLLDSLSP